MRFTKVDYDIDQGFPIPRDLSFHSIKGQTLAIAPTIPAWTVLDSPEVEVLGRLARGATLRESFDALQSWQLEDQQERLKSLLSRLAIDGFLEAEECAGLRKNEVTLQIHVTNACNLRCTHCYVSSGKPFPDEIGFEKWIEVIDAAHQYHDKVYVSISGGEPLLVPWLPELLQHIRMKGLRSSVLSNGMLWTDKRIKQIGKYVDLVNVSLDGASEAVHDAVRGRGAFRQAMRGIRRIGEAGIEVGINICLMKSNIADIEQHMDALIKQFPFKVSVLFGKFVEEGRGLEIKSEQVPQADLQRVLKSMATKFLEDGWQPTSLSKRRNCGFGQAYAIYANGDVSPCLSPIFIAGNVMKSSPADVFGQIAGKSAHSDVDRLPLCRTCDLRYICGGGCHLPQLKNDKEIAQNECSAQFRQNYYERLALRAAQHRDLTVPLLSRPV